MKDNMKSECCNAQVTTKLDLYPEKKEIQATNYYICKDCSKPCNVKEE